ncbi:MAG: PhzF family phenazine biosynthesis protein [Asgard group archaeon]|nr:PhzF family phenazine biosynthesis protein [Asgard group archaeon]
MVIYQVDAFTETPYHGNPTVVILDGQKYDEETKLAIAKEMNLAITTFVLDSTKADYKLAFFTPKKEIDFSGHAIIAVFWLLAKLGKIKSEENPTKKTVETNKGIVPVELQWKNEAIEKVLFQPFELDIKEVSIDKKTLADILGIRQDKIENNDKLPLVIASVGVPKLLVLISSKEMTDALVPNFDKLLRFCFKLKVSGVHLYTFDTYLEGSTCYSRQFQPLLGVNETPVSGLGNAALAAFLVKKGFAQPGRILLEQGESLFRAGLVEVYIQEKKKEEKMSIKVAGKAVIVFKISLEKEIS